MRTTRRSSATVPSARTSSFGSSRVGPAQAVIAAVIETVIKQRSASERHRVGGARPALHSACPPATILVTPGALRALRTRAAAHKFPRRIRYRPCGRPDGSRGPHQRHRETNGVPRCSWLAAMRCTSSAIVFSSGLNPRGWQQSRLSQRPCGGRRAASLFASDNYHISDDYYANSTPQPAGVNQFTPGARASCIFAVAKASTCLDPTSTNGLIRRRPWRMLPSCMSSVSSTFAPAYAAAAHTTQSHSCSRCARASAAAASTTAMVVGGLRNTASYSAACRIAPSNAAVTRRWMKRRYSPSTWTGMTPSRRPQDQFGRALSLLRLRLKLGIDEDVAVERHAGHVASSPYLLSFRAGNQSRVSTAGSF
jgi:hypothetical protein